MSQNPNAPLPDQQTFDYMVDLLDAMDQYVVRREGQAPSNPSPHGRARLLIEMEGYKRALDHVRRYLNGGEMPS